MKTAEEIIIAKRFFELSPSEKEVVREYAANEEEYEAMRWFLISARNSFVKEKIQPSAGLRKGVMAHLQQKQAAPKTVWLNGVGAFLFPAEKRFYQYPAFQMAAVAVLIVSAVALYNNNNPVSQDLAVNDKITAPQQQPAETPLTSTGADNATTDENLLNDQARKTNPGMPAQPVAVDALTNEGAEAASPAETDGDQAAPDASTNTYRWDMSVAEEIKLNSTQNDFQGISQSDSVSFNGLITNNGSYNVASIEKFGFGVTRNVDLKNSASESDKAYKKDDGKKSRSEGYFEKTNDELSKDAPASEVTTTLAGTPVTNATTTDSNVGTTTNTNGNTYYSFTTTKDSSGAGTLVADDVEEQSNAAKYNIAETKALKTLYFVVK